MFTTILAYISVGIFTSGWLLAIGADLLKKIKSWKIKKQQKIKEETKDENTNDSN